MADAAASLRLHVGGETLKAGWTILNIQPGDHVDIAADCTNLSQFASESVAEIYASHVIEHLDYLEDLPKALNEFHRVLQVEGVLSISVPDLEVLCRLFLHPKLDRAARFHVMRIMFGGQMDPHDFHKVGLTEEFLRDYLDVAGFRKVDRIEKFGLFDDSSSLHLGDIPVSLNLRATR